MSAKHTPVPQTREVALLLPGMTLNETIFPDLGVPTIAPDFNALVLGRNGGDVARHGMQPYVRLLDWHLGVEPAWRNARRLVVAHSFGGMLALQWLLEGDPATSTGIVGLVLIATSPGPLYGAVRLRVARALGRDWRIPFAPFLPLWNRPVVTRLVKRMLTRGSELAQRVDFARLEDFSDTSLDRAGWRNTDWRAMRSYRLALQGFDARASLRRIETPTVVLHGTRDSLLPPSTARELADGLPHAELRIVEGAGHGLPLTHPTAVQEAVRDVIGRRGG